MAKTNRNGGCLWGLIVWLIVGGSIIYVYDSIVKLLSDKKVDSVPTAQTENERLQQKLKEDETRLAIENQKKIEDKKINKFKEAAARRFVFSELTVRDKYSGLVWTRKGNFADCYWHETANLLKELNSKRYGGFNNWRLPSKNELVALRDYVYKTNNDPTHASLDSAFHEMGFLNIEHGSYWTSSSVYKKTIHYYRAPSLRVYNVWEVDMGNGNVAEWDRQGYRRYVWPVRSGK